MDTTALRIEKRIPPSLKGTIYEKMAIAIAEELYGYRQDIKKQKQYLWDAAEMDRERLIQISKTFDVPFTATINESEEFARQEVLAIPFKIKFKGTATLYKSLFLAANRMGQIFIYYYQSASKALIRYAKDPLADLLIIPPGEPFTYLMTAEYLNFLSINMEYGRRAKEVPHIGSQLNIQTDLSGTFDSFSPGSPYTIPALKLKAATRPDVLSLIESVDDLLYIEFGTGSQPLPSIVPGNTTPFPTALAQRVSYAETIYKERFENTRSIGVVGECIGQQINKYALGTADGITQQFNYVLPYKPIRRGNVRIIISHSSMTPKILADDRVGNLIGDYGTGTIDYRTGELTINTKFDKHITEAPVVPPAYDSSIEPNKTMYDIQLKSQNIQPNSMMLTFHVGDGDKERIVMVKDNGNGSFILNSQIMSSSIDYAAGHITIQFNQPLTPNSAFEIVMAYPVDFMFPAGAEIVADYYFTQATIEITEAGLFNAQGNLVSYATFPPFEFTAVDNHLNVFFAFRKDQLLNGAAISP